MNRDPKHKKENKIMMKRDGAAAAAESEDEEVVAGEAKRVAGDGSSIKSCQADNCSADLTAAKTYHRRHKVCELHAKAQVVALAGIRQRFCQQCSRFHEVSEFDEAKRSCRRRLAGHNERRRKNPTSDNCEAEGSRSSRSKGNDELKDMVCGQVDDRGRIQITVQETNSTYKHDNPTSAPSLLSSSHFLAPAS